MNFSQLECFVSLAGTLNFVQTAEQLNLSQPAVSKQLKALEVELNTTLFKRTSRSVVITPAGEDFLKNARELLRLYYSSKEMIKSYETRGLNHLRIGYADPNMLPLLKTLLAKLCTVLPKERLYPEFILDQTDANLSRLKKSQLDLIIGMKDARFDDSEIIFRKLNENSFKCVLPSDHPLTARFREQGSLDEISTETLWPYRQILAIPPYLLKNFYSRGLRIIPVNDALDNIVCSTTAEAYALVEAGFGYAMIPKFLLKDSGSFLNVTWKESPHAPFGIYYQPLADKKSNLSVFIDLIRNHFRETED